MRLLGLVLVMLLFLPVTAAAQDWIPVFCGALSQPDCDLLKAAVTATSDLQSVSFEYTITSILDVPNSEEDASTTESIRGGVSDLTAFTDISSFWGTLRSSKLSLTIAMSMSGFPTPVPEANTPDFPSETFAEIRVINGTLYVHLASLQPALEDAGLPEWGSFDLHGQIEQRLQQQENSSQLYLPVVTGIDLYVLLETFDEDVLGEFVSVTRAENTYETRIDFAAMYANPQFQQTLREQLLARWEYSGRGGTIGEAQLNRLAEAMALAFPQPQLVQTVTVDPAERFITDYTRWVMWDFDILIEAAMGGSDITTWKLAEMTMHLHLSDHNSALTITEPGEAEPISIEVLRRIPALSGFLY